MNTQNELLSLKDKAKDRLLTLIEFLKNPILGMRNLPDWPWQELLILQTAFSAACGIARGIVSAKILSIFAGVIFYPIGVLILLGIASGFFYYVFLFFYKKEVDFKKLFTVMMFACVPGLLLSTLSSLLPPIQLLSVLTCLFLLVVGFSENFHLPKQKMTKLLGGIFLVYLIFWIYGSISTQKVKTSFRHQASPESVDILEQEFKND